MTLRYFIVGNDRLYQLRRLNHYTQNYIQALTGIDQSDYSKLETGKRSLSIEQCRKLALMYGTSMDYIAGLTDEMKPYPRSREFSEPST